MPKLVPTPRFRQDWRLGRLSVLKAYSLIITLIGSIALQFNHEARGDNTTVAAAIPNDGSSVAQVALTFGKVAFISNTPVITFQITIKNLNENTIRFISSGLYNGANFFSVNEKGDGVEFKGLNPSGEGTRGYIPIAHGATYLIKEYMSISLLRQANGKIATMFQIFTTDENGHKKNQYEIYSDPVPIPSLTPPPSDSAPPSAGANNPPISTSKRS
jgi:hypothetical protein